MNIKLFAQGKRYDVLGRYDGTSLTVLKGSRISRFTTFGDIRDDVLILKNCSKDDEEFILEKDIVFQTPTAAANFCTGGSVNGWDFWKNASRKPLKALVEHKLIKKPRKCKHDEEKQE